MNKLVYIIISTFIIISACNPQKQYIKNQGFVFGTSYHFIYEDNGKGSLEKEVMAALRNYSNSLSNYDTSSIISKINRNIEVKTDSLFSACFNTAQEISISTNGAFDITVAPIVNAWGFGFKNMENVDSSLIDSLMQFVGFKKVKFIKGKIIKEFPGTQLDVSAIGKGQGVDVAANILGKHGIENYMVEIGGELRAKGRKMDGSLWSVGIDKPVEQTSLEQRQLQEIIKLSDISMATSGNYRQFYEKDGIKYSHTINPITGYPARHSLLSATILAPNCMTADAYATACMVMGLKESIKLIEEHAELEAYFIYDSAGTFSTYISKGFPSTN
jgi:thiamine biosynthesis lipoprotein